MKCDDCKSIKYMERKCCGNLKNWDSKECRLRSIDEMPDGCEHYEKNLKGVFDRLDMGEPDSQGDDPWMQTK